MAEDKSSVEMKEEARVAEEHTQPISVTPEQERVIRRHFDRRIVPIVCIAYVLSYLDRGNIGNAKTAGAQKDLHLSSSQWTWVLNAFYIAYVLMDWTQILWKIFPAHIFVASLCVLWGICAMSAGAVHGLSSLVVVRVFLGIFEASFGAGAPYFLSLFYQRQELAFRTSLLLGMSPLANCFASALAYGISQIRGSLQPWRFIFIIEGAPTILFAPVVFFLLPDSPGTAKFLDEREQTHALERMQTRDHTKKSGIHWKAFLAGLVDYRNFIHMAIHFMCNYSFAGLSNFLPTIVQNMGYTSINAQGLTAPIYFLSFLCCVAAALISDKWGNRGLIIMTSATVGTVGYILLAILEEKKYNSVRYFAVWLAVCGIYPALAINITWLLNNNVNESKRGAGLAVLAVFGQCSSFLSSAMFPNADAPFFQRGCAIGAAFTGCIVLLAAALFIRLRTSNAHKDRLHGRPQANEQLDITDLGEAHPSFRYFL
ncbi:hypothetical protein BAUCODRAFT_172188 [Baudoinia panamericana UAMH 10762]|uniref:Major facilitator superfamily (MFS) profile domain-containing protein n=1 Tax=Baudoinia panamericana (strain UAMH 10762) TaxID=717646 RepID=M2M0J9_BAUPA|nr:uncharacterized protein BAUCODRAFT_172188 [Baudoinia panamericana UAMH 10762]EMD00513.1 hypothetical protein BAUCODRAFT_172188 [Baudoinia panamericana UAMH 10762]